MKNARFFLVARLARTAAGLIRWIQFPKKKSKSMLEKSGRVWILV
jgi:hypothetical protein